MKLKGKLITTFLVILFIFSTFISLLMTGGMRQSYEVQLQENTLEMTGWRFHSSIPNIRALESEGDSLIRVIHW